MREFRSNKPARQQNVAVEIKRLVESLEIEARG
jgi:hypothetical protein